MNVNTLEVAGFASALLALRLPYNKGTKSRVDVSNSIFLDESALNDADEAVMAPHIKTKSNILVSPDDIKLMQTLEARGDSHAKPVRGIIVYADITAPIHWWGEVESYRAGHERLFSASTMNAEGKALKGKELAKVLDTIPFSRPIHKIDFFSYQCLRNIVKQRYNHRKIEWHEFIEWIKTLPLAADLILYGLEHEIEVHTKMYAEMLD